MQKFPLAYRWLRANGVSELIPLCFSDGDSTADEVFSRETTSSRMVLAFARRQDRDECAGFEVVNHVATNRVIQFVPTFEKRRNPHLVFREYDNLWLFLTRVVIPDTEEWATEEELEELLSE